MAEFFGTTIADIFNTMPRRFKPEASRGIDVVIGYECGGEDGGKWKLTVKDQKANDREGRRRPGRLHGQNHS